MLKEEELMKYRETNILQFIKIGKLDMIMGLINYYNLAKGLDFMSLKG